MEVPGELEVNYEVARERTNRVAILDAGAQYGKVIDRRVRGLNIESEILPLDTPMEDLEGYDAFIISGGPDSVYAPDSPKPDPRVFYAGKPILGICYGMQLINQEFGGSVEKINTREDGQVKIAINLKSTFFDGMEPNQEVLMSHGDSINEVAPGFLATAISRDIVAAIADEDRKIYGVQFHPEVDLTENGIHMLENFLTKIAGLEQNYTLEDRYTEAIKYIQEVVGDRQVISFVSGGVDSTVCSVLLSHALPEEQVTIIHVDTGFMRKDESRKVQAALAEIGIHMEVIDARETFYNAKVREGDEQSLPLFKVSDPEEKRFIIGNTFIQLFYKIIADHGLDLENIVLAQGTLRPDLIESASKLASSKADVIKTHHNDSGAVRELRGKNRVVEPLQHLHKDEVRELGEKLGLPHELVWRMPFPGPGLAVRILCGDQPYLPEGYHETRLALRAFEDEDIAVRLLPVRSVGVQGDGRTYKNAAAVSGPENWEKYLEMAREIPKQVHGVNRVVYIFGDKYDGEFEDVTETYLTEDTIEQLRLADNHVNEVLEAFGINEELSQVPVISIGVHFGIKSTRTIIIRAFKTNDFMTGVAAVPGVDFQEEALREMVKRIKTVPGIDGVAYDLTPKPPGTTEWE